MALFKKALVLAALTAAGFATVAGTAFAGQRPHANGGDSADNNSAASGLVAVNALNQIHPNVSPNLGCLVKDPAEDVDVAVIAVQEIVENIENFQILSPGAVLNEVEDKSCTSNQGNSQAGHNTHGGSNVGDASSSHSNGDGAGSENANGNGAGGLTGPIGLLGSATGLGAAE